MSDFLLDSFLMGFLQPLCQKKTKDGFNSCAPSSYINLFIILYFCLGMINSFPTDRAINIVILYLRVPLTAVTANQMKDLHQSEGSFHPFITAVTMRDQNTSFHGFWVLVQLLKGFSCFVISYFSSALTISHTRKEL